MTTQVVPTAADMAEVEEDRSVASLPTATDIAEIAARFRCLNDHLLVKLDDRPRMFGLLHLPDTSQSTERQRWATVVKAGPGAWFRKMSRGREPMHVEAGDRVLLSGDPGWELAEGHRVLRVGAVMAVERAEQ